MSEKVEANMGGINVDDRKEFQASRNDLIEKFRISSRSVFKRKITQALYWSSSDKDLADQYLRDERWIFGMKFWDALKVIDHGTDDAKGSIGFKSK